VKLPDIEWIQGRDDIDIVVGIQTEGIQRAIGDFIQRVAIGIGRLELESSSEVVRGSQCQAGVGRVADFWGLCHHPKWWVRLGESQPAKRRAGGTKSI